MTKIEQMGSKNAFDRIVHLQSRRHRLCRDGFKIGAR
jgi:hypothetical protein